MKKLAILLAALFLASGCGTLRVHPKGCKTDAEWGISPTATRGITLKELEDEKTIDISARQEFYVFSDHDLSIQDLLESNGMKCDEIKKLRVVIKTSWFFIREVSLKVVKK